MNTGVAGRAYAGTALAIALAGMAFVLHASYPGYPNPDSVAQAMQALGGYYDDWQSPFPKWLWGLLLKLVMDPATFIVLVNLLIWGAILALVLGLRRPLGNGALVLAAMPLLPGVFNFLGNVHVDALLAGWLMAGSACAYFVHRPGLSPRRRRLLRVAANLCLIAAFLTRLNAVFALVPLLIYVNAGGGTRRTLAISAALLLAMPLLNAAQNRLLQVHRLHPADSIKTYHLLALSYAEGRNLLPGAWTPEQDREILAGCYTPIQWDVAWRGRCRFIHDQLTRQGLWGSMKLTRTWLRETLSRPAAWFSMLTATYKLSLFDPNSRAMLYQTPNPWGWAVAEDPPRASTYLAKEYVHSELNNHLSRPWIFALLMATGVVVLLRRRIAEAPEGRFALAILGSGLVYLLTYLVFNVSAEYRYFYWCAFAAYTGLPVALLAAWRRRGEGRPEAAGGGATAVRIAALGLAGAAVALVVFPHELPKDRRIVAITPADERPVAVVAIRNLATPAWINQPFQGDLAPIGWSQDGQGYRSGTRRTPLVAALDTLKEDIEVVLATGPGMGAALVGDTGQQQLVDTSAAAAGTRAIRLPPPRQTEAGHSPAHLPLFCGALALVLGGLAFYCRPVPPARLFRHQLVGFSFVGAIGFAVEAVLLGYFATIPALGAVLGRGISFPVAVLVTWWLNRRLTFQSDNHAGTESLRYFGVQLLGVAANLAVYLTLVALFPSLAEIPVVPLVPASAAGLLVNFSLSKTLVFRSHAGRR